jgi:hypothetical protein
MIENKGNLWKPRLGFPKKQSTNRVLEQAHLAWRKAYGRLYFLQNHRRQHTQREGV